MSNVFDFDRARVQAGYSIRGLARAAGVSDGTVRRVAAGKPIRPEKAKAIADLIGAEVLDLIPLANETQEAA